MFHSQIINAIKNLIKMNDLPSEIIVLISRTIDAPVDWLSFRMCSKLCDACSLVGDQKKDRMIQVYRRRHEKLFAPVFAIFQEAKEIPKKNVMILY